MSHGAGSGQNACIVTMQPPAPVPSRRVQTTVLIGYVAILVAWMVAGLWLLKSEYSEPARFVLLPVVLTVQLVWSWMNDRDPSGARRFTAFAAPRTGGPPVLVAPGRVWWRTHRAPQLFTAVGLIQYWAFSIKEIGEIDWVLWSSIPFMLVVAVGLVATMVALLRDIRGGGDLELRPGGLSLPGPLGRIELPWEEVPSGRLKRHRDGDPLVLRVRRRSGSLFRRRRVTVHFDRYAVAPALLTGAIRHYLDHPEHRAAIGTDEEYVRLHVLLYPEPEPAG
jgi:hypothetical protein